jgi:serine/threonine protein kinase
VSQLTDSEVEELHREIQVITGLKHLNVVQVVATWDSPDKAEIVLITEVVSGGPLTAYLRKIKTPLRKVVRQWCREILEALGYLHSRGVLHRDLRIDNICIDSNTGNARLCNLGLSNSVFKSSSAEHLAPEVYDQEYSVSADIYALGIAVLEICTRSKPYVECSNTAAIYHRLMSGVKPKCLSRIQDAEVKDFILSCLMPVEERPQASELLKHPFLSTLDNEKDDVGVLLSPDGDSAPTKILDGKDATGSPTIVINPVKPHTLSSRDIPNGALAPSTVRLDLQFDTLFSQGENPFDIVGQLGLNKVGHESLVPELKAQVTSDQRNISHFPRPSSFTVLSPFLHTPLTKAEEMRRVATTTSLIDLDYGQQLENIHIPIAFTVLVAESPARVEFDYSVTFDNPNSVARALVHELSLPADSVSLIACQIRQAVSGRPIKCHSASQTQDLEPQCYRIEDHSTMAEVLAHDLSFEKVCSPFATGTISPIEGRDPSKLHNDIFSGKMPVIPKLVKSYSEKPKRPIEFVKDIQIGDQSENVKTVQRALNKLSRENSLKVSGKFNMATWIKVVNFQEDQALVVDGVVRQPTWERLVAKSRQGSRVWGANSSRADV